MSKTARDAAADAVALPKEHADRADAAEALLDEAYSVLRDISLRLLAVKPWLDVPYPDLPESSPWKHTIERRARRAHDLSVTIAKHLAALRPSAEALARADAAAVADDDLDLTGAERSSAAPTV